MCVYIYIEGFTFISLRQRQGVYYPLHVISIHPLFDLLFFLLYVKGLTESSYIFVLLMDVTIGFENPFIVVCKAHTI